MIDYLRFKQRLARFSPCTANAVGFMLFRILCSEMQAAGFARRFL